MTTDFEHHLEVVPRAGELSVYVYDEFTQPVSTDSVNARIELTRSDGTVRSIVLARAAEKGRMVAMLPGSSDPRPQASLIVRFAGQEREQSYVVELLRAGP